MQSSSRDQQDMEELKVKHAGAKHVQSLRFQDCRIIQIGKDHRNHPVHSGFPLKGESTTRSDCITQASVLLHTGKYRRKVSLILKPDPLEQSKAPRGQSGGEVRQVLNTECADWQQKLRSTAAVHRKPTVKVFP